MLAAVELLIAVNPDPDSTLPYLLRPPTARAGITDLQIMVDSHEQYPYRFAGQQVGLPVPVRGKLAPGVWEAWRDAHRG